MARASLIFLLLICSFVNGHVIFEQPKTKEEKNIPNQPLISSVTRTKLHPHMIYQGSTTYTTLKKNYKKETHCYISKNLLKWYQHYMSLQSWRLLLKSGVVSQKRLLSSTCFVITGQRIHTGKLKPLKYADNVNFEGTDSVDSISGNL